MIEVEGLTKVYARSSKDGTKALDCGSFDVPDDTIFRLHRPERRGAAVA